MTPTNKPVSSAPCRQHMALPAGPVISVLTPAYNASHYLTALIESVRSQDYAYIEHIIIDDGSCDDSQTVTILKQYPHLKWQSRPNHGQYHTQNSLLRLATGDYVTFICADDLYAHQAAISSIVNRIRLHPGVDIVFGRTPRLVDYEPKLSYHADISGYLARHIVRHFPAIQHCSVFVRRDLLLQEHLFFDPSYRMRGDWDWLIRLFNRAASIEYVPEDITYWRMHALQTSRLAYTHGQGETKRVCAHHGTRYAFHTLCAKVAAYYSIIRYAIAICSGYGPAQLVKTASRALLRRTTTS